MPIPEVVFEPRAGRKCIVHDCENWSDQGNFVGSLCDPCYELIRTGKLNHGKTFLHRALQIQDLISRILKRRGITAIALAKYKGQAKPVTWKGELVMGSHGGTHLVGFGDTPNIALTNLEKHLEQERR